MSELIIRRARVSDRGLIYDSWLRGYRGGNAVKGVHPDIYHAMYPRVIEELLETSTTLVLANAQVDHEDPYQRDQVVGFGCFQDADPAGIIHYVYMKKPFRGQGFARRLVEHFFGKIPPLVFVTHFTGCTKFLMRHAEEKYPEIQVVYNPFLAMDRMPVGWTIQAANEYQKRHRAHY